MLVGDVYVGCRRGYLKIAFWSVDISKEGTIELIYVYRATGSEGLKMEFSHRYELHKVSIRCHISVPSASTWRKQYFSKPRMIRSFEQNIRYPSAAKFMRFSTIPDVLMELGTLPHSLIII